MASLDGINGRSIQTMLRGENDSKQSGEIQVTFTDCFNCLHTERSPQIEQRVFLSLFKTSSKQ